MNINELEAKLEGFKSKEEYIKYFQEINNVSDINCEIWVIKFKKIQRLIK